MVLRRQRHLPVQHRCRRRERHERHRRRCRQRIIRGQHRRHALRPLFRVDLRQQHPHGHRLPEAITVVYTDTQSAINTSSITAANISVTGINSTPLSVTLASISGSGGTVTAVYAVLPPHGSWSDADNGTYSVNVIANSVTDQAGGGVSRRRCVSFTVAISASQPPHAPGRHLSSSPSLLGRLPKPTLVAGGKIVPIHQTVRVKNTGATIMTGTVTVNLLLSPDPTGQSNGTSAGTFHKRITL